MKPEDIPQSVMMASFSAFRESRGVMTEAIAAALQEYERLGYRLIYDDEVTELRVAEALHRQDSFLNLGLPADQCRVLARAAIRGAQEGGAS